MRSCRLEIVNAQPDLLQMVLATRPAGRLAGLLDSRQEHADEDADDGDHHEEFNQGKR
jgi:hypothetical protein